jgi:hypothetical protein
MNSLGLGLNIVIDTEYTPCHDWMTFSAWYSIKKTFPDAKVVIRLNKRKINRELFLWIPKFKVKMTAEFSEKPLLIIPNNVIATREFSENTNFEELVLNDSLCADAKKDDVKPFISYKDGWGNFVLDEWIDKNESPFSNAERFSTNKMSINEVRILKAWKYADFLYSSVSRS